MEYQNVKLIEAKRKKVLMLSIILSIFIHLLLFFALKIQFLGYREVRVTKIIRIKRVNIPRGNRPGQLSASAARKRAKPKPIRKKAIKPIKKKVKPKKKIKSKLKVATKKKMEEEVTKETEIALDQEVSEHDVLSMIEGDVVIPGGGNLGDDEGAWGLTYDENTVFEFDDSEEVEEVKVRPDRYLGTMATPIVTSKPYTSIEDRHPDIPYPSEVRIKKEKLTSGVSRVYLRLYINSSGEITDIYVRSPKSKADKKKYALFLDTVINSVNEWRFDHQKTIVFVDVRFTIE